MKRQKAKLTCFRGELYGLAEYRPLAELYHGRVATAVRDKLRAEFGDARVQVPCHADLIDSKWHGRCKIDGAEYEYHVFMEDGVKNPVVWIPGLSG